MGLKIGFHPHHSVFLHHGTDGCNPGFVRFGGIRYAINQDFGARFKLPELVFQYIETDLQVFGVHDVEERHARSGGAVQRCLDPAHGPRERRRNGAEGQFALQLFKDSNTSGSCKTFPIFSISLL